MGFFLVGYSSKVTSAQDARRDFTENVSRKWERASNEVRLASQLLDDHWSSLALDGHSNEKCPFSFQPEVAFGRLPNPSIFSLF